MTWPTASLDELCEINVGRTPARANPAYWGRGEPWLSIADMNQGREITRTKEQITAAGAAGGRQVPPGTVLLSFKLSIGKVAKTAIPLYTNEAIASLPIKRQDLVIEDFLTRALEQAELSGNSNRAAMGATLNKAKLKEIRIPLPPLSEQRRIAAILDHADALRAKRRQVLAHLDSLVRSIFNNMFETSSSFESLELRQAVKWKSGKFLPAREQKDGPYPVYGGNGINGSHDNWMFEEPRLVVGRVGAYCGAVHVTTPYAWVTDNALIATILRDDLNLNYLEPALTIANLNQYAGVSGQPSISGGKIGKVRIPIPPIRLQQQFAERVIAIGSSRNSVSNAAHSDSLLFSALQDRAFRGEL